VGAVVFIETIRLVLALSIAIVFAVGRPISREQSLALGWVAMVPWISLAIRVVDKETGGCVVINRLAKATVVGNDGNQHTTTQYSTQFVVRHE